ncbi:MAG TPA: hypothetical protein ENF99_00925 [Candidatus Aenigmarchaeota archaeon]|nr:hypothetical protein [Candidatus Aenigmarchaeota archaeon]
MPTKRIDDKRLVGVFKDKDLKLAVMILSYSEDPREREFYEKMCEYFERGLIKIGFDPKNQNITTSPPVTLIHEIEMRRRKFKKG